MLLSLFALALAAGRGAKPPPPAPPPAPVVDPVPAEVAADWADVQRTAAVTTPASLAALDAFLARWAERPDLPEVLLAGVRHAELDSALEPVPLVAGWTASAPGPLPAAAGRAPKLRLLSTRVHGFDDYTNWLAANALSLGRTGDAPPFLHQRGLAWVQDGRVAVYRGDDGSQLVAVLGADGGVMRVFDPAALVRAPVVVPGDEAYVAQLVQFADVRDGVLYLVTAHRTYAASSGGQNAYVTAYDAATGALRWRSAPLVANAADIAFVSGWIVAGYGFTAERDYLYVLSPSDGTVAARVALPTGPDFVLEREGKLYVRTYDKELIFAVE